MPQPPPNPKIYHLTHIDNLPSIIQGGGLVSDAVMIQNGSPPATVGMSKIKERRLTLPVDCHPGDCVGDYVPFYFCPRSVMLFLLFKSNHPDLSYKGGQGPIVHLEADLNSVVGWATENGQRWAFSLSNAGAYYVQFRRHLQDLGEIDWNAVLSSDFRSADTKESKAAEFLLYGSFPWALVETVGVHSMGVGQKVTTAVTGASHIPKIEIRKDWYF